MNWQSIWQWLKGGWVHPDWRRPTPWAEQGEGPVAKGGSGLREPGAERGPGGGLWRWGGTAALLLVGMGILLLWLASLQPPAPGRGPGQEASSRSQDFDSPLAGLPKAGEQGAASGSGAPVWDAPAEPGAGAQQLAMMEAYRRQLEERLARILSQVEGAGQVSVEVALASGTEMEYAWKESHTQRQTVENDGNGGRRQIDETTRNRDVEMASSGSGQQPVLQEARPPAVAGVLVLADGAADAAVSYNLSQAVQTLLHLPAHRVQVLARRAR
ncbi:MAG: hypothetical protein IMW99_00460 [Firmicutes bacterium]|nr:hypothetical protein [Bacillota bacterium]